MFSLCFVLVYVSLCFVSLCLVGYKPLNKILCEKFNFELLKIDETLETVVLFIFRATFYIGSCYKNYLFYFSRKLFV